jgi:hypothetical protein
MRESQYQSKLIKTIKKMFPGCIVLKNDSGYLQGVPDIIVLYENLWGSLEIKINEDAEVQPNQAYYIDKMDNMSFAAFIHPGNEAEVLHGLQEALGLAR